MIATIKWSCEYEICRQPLSSYGVL